MSTGHMSSNLVYPSLCRTACTSGQASSARSILIKFLLRNNATNMLQLACAPPSASKGTSADFAAVFLNTPVKVAATIPDGADLTSVLGRFTCLTYCLHPTSTSVNNCLTHENYCTANLQKESVLWSWIWNHHQPFPSCKLLLYTLTGLKRRRMDF